MNRRIFIDPGHGGESTGATYGGVHEKDVNLETALALKKLLEDDDFTVFLSREDDRYLSLNERVELAHALEVEVFISIHHNASYEDAPNRAEIYYKWCDTCPSKVLADLMLENLRKELDVDDGFTMPATYTVLRNRIPVSILTEAFYMKYYTPERVHKEALAIYKALKRFYELGFPKITSYTLKQGYVELEVEGRWDNLTSSSYLDGRKLLILKEENVAKVLLPNQAGKLEVVLRNSFGVPCEPFKALITLPPSTAYISVFPGCRNLPNLVSIHLYDEMGNPVGDGLDVLLRINDYQTILKTRKGIIKLVSELKADTYEVRIETLDMLFEERFELAENCATKVVRVDGAFDGYAVSQNETFPILEGGYIFVDRYVDSLDIYARGFENEKCNPNGSYTIVHPKPLLEGAFHRRKILVVDENFGELSFELYNKLWYLGAEARIVVLEDELEAIREAIDFRSEILIHLVKGTHDEVAFYEYDRRGKDLAMKLARKLNCFFKPSSKHILIQPFGARVSVELKEYDRNKIWKIVEALKEHLTSQSLS